MRYYIPSKLPFLKPRLITFTELFEEVSAGLIKQDTEIIWMYRGRKTLSAGDLIRYQLKSEELKWCNHGDPVENGTVYYRASSFKFSNSYPTDEPCWENIWFHGIWPHSFSIRLLLCRNGHRNLYLDPRSNKLYDGSWHWDAYSESADAEIIVNDKETSDLLKSLLLNKCSGSIVITLRIRSQQNIVSGSDISGRVNDFSIESEQCL